MFDIGWNELLVIAMVAIVVIGPKDLPRVMRTVGQWVRKLKRMGGEFQSQFNEALREAELDDVRKSVVELGKINPLTNLRDEVTRVGDDIKQGLDVNAPSAAATAADATPAEAPPVEASPAESASVASSSPEPEPLTEMSLSAETPPPAAKPVETIMPAPEPAAAAGEVKP